jgi:hypothetical protein
MISFFLIFRALIGYRLASLLPIYQKNGPATDFEKIGLSAVKIEPSKPYTGYYVPRPCSFQSLCQLS